MNFPGGVHFSVTATGGSTVHDIYQTFIVSDRALVADHHYDFSRLIRAHTGTFVGRREIFAALEELARRPCGYFAITAASGLGKTALAAEIARRYQAAAFFASALENRTTAAQCLNHLCADLLVRFDPSVTHLPARSATDSNYLSELLDRFAPDHAPLWIVVDALDEADPIPGRNPLLLPSRLPQGVFVVVTYRPDSILFRLEPGMPRTPVVSLTNEDAGQTRDLDSLLAAEIERLHLNPSAMPRLSAAAAGNFLYLTFLLADLAEGKTGPLPTGLDAYYEHNWQLAAPTDSAVIELLTVASEPVPAKWLADLLGVSQPALDAALKNWRRFIARTATANWRIVHQSFADFAARKIDLAGTHRKVATFFNRQERWPDPYASRHLTTHLRHEPAKLFALIRNPRWPEHQDRHDITGMAYLADVRRGWQTAEQGDAEAAARDAPLPFLPEQAWCATRFSLLANVAPKFILENLRDFVPSDFLPLSTALSLLEHSPGELQSTLSAIWRILEQQGNTPAVFDRLLDFARRLDDENVRWQALRDLVSHAPPDRLATVFEASTTIANLRHALELVQVLIKRSQRPWPASAQAAMLSRIDAFRCPHCQAWLRSLAAGGLSPELRAQAHAQSLAQARGLPSTVYRAWTLARVAAASDPPDRARVIEEAFESAESIENPDFQLRPRLELVEALGGKSPIEGRDLEQLLKLGRGMECQHRRGVFLAAVSHYTSAGQRAAIVAEARSILVRITDPKLSKIAAVDSRQYLGSHRWPAAQPSSPPINWPPQDDEQLLAACRQDIRNAKNAAARARVLLSLARCFTEPERSEALRDAVQEARQAVREEPPATTTPIKKLRVPNAPLNLRLGTVLDYEPLPYPDLAQSLAAIRQMIATPFPLPGNLAESELIGHNVLPWELGGARSAFHDLTMVNLQRLSWLKGLCDLYPAASETQRREILETGAALLATISEPDSAALGRIFFGQVAGSMDAGIDRAMQIRWPAYRAEALVALSNSAPQRQRTEILKAAFRSALEAHWIHRRDFLFLLAPPLSLLPRDEIYRLWRDVLERVRMFEGDGLNPPLPVGGALPALFPMLAALAGEAAANRTIRAANDALTQKI